MINYAKATKQNSLIVALNQEKVYDKINHAYLWCTLQKFGIPIFFINTIKSLYSKAKIYVMINGVLSSLWQIK